MPALANILPLTFLGCFCVLFLALLSYHCWRRTLPRRMVAGSGNPEYEVEEIPGTTDFVMVGRRGGRKRKVKKPKLWDIWVPNFGGRPTHERKLSSGSSLSDLSLSEDVANWAGLKVSTSSLSVRYTKQIFRVSSPCLSHMSKTRTRPTYHLFRHLPHTRQWAQFSNPRRSR